MAYRYRCGECGFSTLWTTESEAEDRSRAHYADRHPQLVPGGSVEINRKNLETVGCLPMIGIALLLLLITASCQR
ncbi:hypothetical protein SJX93_00020 [Streptomyces cyaneofuscatus]|uniref:hypothetical protein n=1 Tax=Streptomyces cyaneofuscatus TaxID=66883 RepID=UPI002D79AA31|nr:hypothetical protein [Streptomyces cyaneofuscatus]WRO08105.1 hypothetical protein SJX93_00020 [Streptomyces cyaneofuscatus]